MFEYDEHIFNFITFMFVFIVATVFKGWSDWIKSDDRFQVHPLQVLWSILFMLLLIEYWWGLWINRPHISGSFVNFLFTVFLTSLFYFGCAFLFDERANDDLPRTDAYFRAMAPVFIIVALIIVCQSIQAQLHRQEHITSVENISRLSGLASMLVLYFARNLLLHWVIYTVTLMTLIYYITFKHMGVIDQGIGLTEAITTRVLS